MNNSMNTVTMLVTPEIATHWLQNCNTDNRHLRPNAVEVLAGQILRGEWKVTHQGIAFSEDNVLLDGQHRLSAVVMANQSVYMRVTYNAPADSFTAIDGGVKRTMADMTKLDSGFTELANLALKMITGSKPSPEQVMTLFQKSPLPECLELLQNHAPRKTRFWSAAPARLAACLRLMTAETQEEQEYVLNTYASLIYQDMPNMPPVAQAIYKQLAMNAPETKSAERPEQLQRFLKVFNMDNRNNKKVSISRRKNGEYNLTEAYDMVKEVIGDDYVK